MKKYEKALLATVEAVGRGDLEPQLALVILLADLVRVQCEIADSLETIAHPFAAERSNGDAD